MILIISKLGAFRQYPDQKMMRKTLGGFLRSLDRQTDRRFRLFVACHDIPEGFSYPWVEWCSMMADLECNETNYWERLPNSLDDPVRRINYPYGQKIADSARKTAHSAIMAGKWAHHNGLKDFWMLRMDSDDMLSKDTIETILKLGDQGYKAIYNRYCHIFDARTNEIGEYRYRFSTTCNALKMRIEGNALPRWYYLCRNHTKFMDDVRNDKIKAKEVDWTYCIVTNSGNSISGRPTLTKEKWAKKIEMTKELADRYGLDIF